MPSKQIKTIGLLGGTSWPSTISYYETLNRMVQARLGGHHSARIQLYSIDYHAIKSRYHDGWNEIPALLHAELQQLVSQKPDCLILCNNTLHRALDTLPPLPMPLFHAGHLAADAAVARGDTHVLLLGTAFTMEDGFFAEYFTARGIQVSIPNAADRQVIQAIQSEVAKGVTSPEYRATLGTLLARYDTVDSVILACTELPLVIDTDNCAKPIINPSECQCAAAVAFALS